jgi:glycosyltransferase involved in cell wall biosynthesis
MPGPEDTSRSEASLVAALSPSAPSRTIISVLDLKPRKFGTMEEYMVLLARALKERGWQCVFVLPEPAPPEVIRHFNGTGAIFEIVPQIRGGCGYRGLYRALRRHSREVVHFHFYSPFSLYPIVAWLSGCRLIAFTQHSRLSERPSSSRACKGFIWGRCVLGLTGTRILTVAAHLKATFVNSYRLSPEIIQVLYNGVNLHRFQPVGKKDVAGLRRELGISADSPVVVAAAYLVPGKGIRDLVSAAPAVLHEKTDAVFVLVGDGPELERLQAQARELGIAKNFRFPGLRSDVNRFMALASVVVMPSVFQEAAGLVVAEAMAATRPVIGTRVGGIPELIDDGLTGILIDPQAPEQLAAALLRLLMAPSLAAAMGAAGRERAEKYFSADRWICDTIAFYERNLS